MKVDQLILAVCVIFTIIPVPISAALPLLAYAAPAIFGLGMLGGFGDKLGLGGLFGKKKKKPSYSPMFGGSFGGMNAPDMSMMFMSGFPPRGPGGMQGGFGGGIPGAPGMGMGGAGLGMGGAGLGGMYMGLGGGMGMAGPGLTGGFGQQTAIFGQQSRSQGLSGFGRRRRRRSFRL